MEPIKEAIEVYLDSTGGPSKIGPQDFVGVHQITVDR